jgi:CRISPR system Cascade subunit CasD
MATLLLRLVGPMQSWGITSRFDERDTGKEPSKSGVLGLLAAALGIDRASWNDLEPLTRLTMAARHDRPGLPKDDYQTAACAATDTIIKASGKPATDGGVVSHRNYLADAAFLVGLEGTDRALLEKAQAALLDPVWPLALGRKSYVPSEPIGLPDGLREEPLRDALLSYPWLGSGEPPIRILCSWESADGSGAFRMDQPLSSFAERRFGSRLVLSEWVSFPAEVPHALA